MFKSIYRNRPELHPGTFEIHVAVLLFGFSGLFGKFLHCSPAIIVFGRTFIAALGILPLVRFSGNNALPAEKKTICLFFLQGILLAAHWCTFFHSIQISSVAVGLLTFSTFPLFVTFMEPFVFNEPLKLYNIGLSVFVFAGLVLVIPTFDFSQAPAKGALWGIASGFSFALLALVNRKNVQTLPPLTVTFYQNFFAAVVMLPVIGFSTPPFPGINELILLIILGVLCTAVAHFMFIKALMHIKAHTAGIITSLEPVYGILLAFFLLGEHPDFRTLSGGIIIISATTIVMLKKIK